MSGLFRPALKESDTPYSVSVGQSKLRSTLLLFICKLTTAQNEGKEFIPALSADTMCLHRLVKFCVFS